MAAKLWLTGRGWGGGGDDESPPAPGNIDQLRVHTATLYQESKETKAKTMLHTPIRVLSFTRRLFAGCNGKNYNSVPLYWKKEPMANNEST